MKRFDEQIEERELPSRYILIDSRSHSRRIVAWIFECAEAKKRGVEGPRFPFLADFERALADVERCGLLDEEGLLTEKAEKLKECLKIY